jgi:hypothetical protein
MLDAATELESEMSNWSVVSVSFSGLEHVSIQAVQDAVREYGPWTVIPACSEPSAAGNAVEWWLTTHINHFQPDELAECLSVIDWRLPCEVCIIWKNEHMSVPRVEMVFPQLIDKVSNPEQVNLGLRSNAK